MSHKKKRSETCPTRNNWDLWHRRLCHHHLAGIKKLLSGNLVMGFKLDSQASPDPNLIDEHGLNDSKPVSTPLNPGTRLSTSMCPQNDAEALEMRQYPYISVIGCLMYLAVTTRPDIAYAAGVLARFNSNPGLAHWQAAKHVLHYLKGTMDYKLVYQ